MGYRTEFINQTAKKKKFRNVSQLYNGVRYDSIKEAKYAQELDWLLKLGEIKSWSRQIRIDLKVNGVHIANMYPDFLVEHNDGELEIKEVKSKITMTPEWKLKWAILGATILDHFPGGCKLTVVI